MLPKNRNALRDLKENRKILLLQVGRHLHIRATVCLSIVSIVYTLFQQVSRSIANTIPETDIHI